MGDTATGTWGSRELGAHIDREKAAKRLLEAAEYVATIDAKATSDFADEIATMPSFTNCTQELQAVAQQFYKLGYTRASMKLVQKTIKGDK
jgi:hypothetical protein